ncbi:Uncharacterized protein Fot_09751 [Forsythia ovata]|uniref:Uncharacterized protein n=1 Tax=Forsythia ovata TaxID=205694 RepID=A0ABD1WEW2_9LAMI
MTHDNDSLGINTGKSERNRNLTTPSDNCTKIISTRNTNSGSRRKWWVTAETQFQCAKFNAWQYNAQIERAKSWRRREGPLLAQMVGHSLTEQARRGLSTKEAPQREERVESAVIWW